MIKKVLLGVLVGALAATGLMAATRKREAAMRHESTAEVDEVAVSDASEASPGSSEAGMDQPDAAAAAMTYHYDPDLGGLDVTRPARFFVPGLRSSAFVYHDSIDLDATTHMSIAGQEIDSDTRMQVESTTTITDLDASANDGGVQEVIIATTRVTMHMEAMGMSFACDTKETTVEDADDMCKPLYEGLRSSNRFVLDEAGNIVEAEGPGAEMAQALGAKAGTSPTTSSSSSSSSSNQLEPAQSLTQASRLLRLVPDVEVKPGDTWSVAEDMDDKGSLQGRSTLKGYKNYQDRDCAVIVTEGTLTMDLSAVLQAMGLDSMNGVTMDDATMQVEMCYDDSIKTALYSTMTIDMTMSMPNPMGNGGDAIHVPVHEVVGTTTQAVPKN